MELVSLIMSLRPSWLWKRLSRLYKAKFLFSWMEVFSVGQKALALGASGVFSFRKYMTFKKDYNELFLYLLNGLVKDALHF
ncbi:hypothetical protein Ancab_014044 [Ancistrocladus abbreviatus]